MDTVGHVLVAELLLDAAALIGLAVETIEGGGQDLFVRGLREEIPGELPRDELVVGQVLVEGLDDPVTPRGEIAVGVGLISIGIGKAREIEPLVGPPLAVGW